MSQNTAPKTVLLTVSYNDCAQSITDRLTADGYTVIQLGADVDYNENRSLKRAAMVRDLADKLNDAQEPVAIVSSQVCWGHDFGYEIAAVARISTKPTLTVIWSTDSGDSNQMDRQTDATHHTAYVEKFDSAPHTEEETAEISDKIGRFFAEPTARPA